MNFDSLYAFLARGHRRCLVSADNLAWQGARRSMSTIGPRQSCRDTFELALVLPLQVD